MLRWDQTFQLLRGELRRTHDAQPIEARIEGTVVHAAQPHGRLRMALHQGKLRVDLAQGPYAALRGLAFKPARAEACS